MFEIAIFAIIIPGLLGLLTSLRFVRPWGERGMRISRPTLFAATGISMAAGTAAWLGGWAVPVVICVSAAGFYASIAAYSDARFFLIPKELTWMPVVCGSFAAGIWLYWGQFTVTGSVLVLACVLALIGAGVGGFFYRWMGAVAGLLGGLWFVVMMTEGLLAGAFLVLMAGAYSLASAWGKVGFGDVRMLGVAAATLWWMPVLPLMGGFCVSLLIGLIWMVADPRVKGRFPLAPGFWAGMAAASIVTYATF